MKLKVIKNITCDICYDKTFVIKLEDNDNKIHICERCLSNSLYLIKEFKERDKQDKINNSNNFKM
jgi:hypothetical protein